MREICFAQGAAEKGPLKKKAPLDWSGAFPVLPTFHQVQTIAPVELSQVFADCECVAVALQPIGGPATSTAVIVTFDEGVNP
jgi:hypothetical protein